MVSVLHVRCLFTLYSGILFTVYVDIRMLLKKRSVGRGRRLMGRRRRPLVRMRHSTANALVVMLLHRLMLLLVLMLLHRAVVDDGIAMRHQVVHRARHRQRRGRPEAVRLGSGGLGRGVHAQRRQRCTWARCGVICGAAMLA